MKRFLQLYAELVLYGTSAALQVRAALGLDPWDVLHQGVSKHTGIAIGTVSILVGAVVTSLLGAAAYAVFVAPFAEVYKELTEEVGAF